MNCPRLGRECNEFMCGSCIDGICQESETHCDFCNEIYDEFKLNTTHPMNREFCNCITYDENDNTYNLWNECEDDYYTGNIMEIKYCICHFYLVFFLQYLIIFSLHLSQIRILYSLFVLLG